MWAGLEWSDFSFLFVSGKGRKLCPAVSNDSASVFFVPRLPALTNVRLPLSPALRHHAGMPNESDALATERRYFAALLAGIINPVEYTFDQSLLAQGILQVKYPLPYSDITSLTEEERSMVRRLDWKAMQDYGASFFCLEKLARTKGVSNPAMVAAFRGETLEQFLKTRRVPGAR